MIDVVQLTKRYGSRYAVRDLSFSLGKGDIVGFLGPNGAGKTTTLRILAGFLGSTAGTVTIAGHDIARDPLEVRKNIGYMPEIVPLYPEMRVVEYLTFRAEVKRVPRRLRRSFVSDAMEQANVIDVAATTIAKLSKGYRQRVGLADALVAKPPVLILDEPTAGLDPNQIREIRTVIKGLANDHTVLLSTHLLTEVEASCTRAIVIHRGLLQAQGTIAELRTLRISSSLDVVVRGEAVKSEEILQGVEGVHRVFRRDRSDGRLEHTALRCVLDAANTDPILIAERSVAALVRAGVGVSDVRLGGGSLEDVFAELTRTARPSDDEV